MAKFTGTVQRIIFANNTDLYKVLAVTLVGELPGYDQDEIKVTGNFGAMKVDSTYSFEGKLVYHDKFGLQFKAAGYHAVLPHEEGSLTKYLSSTQFPGIGEKTAKKIINKLGLNALNILKRQPAKVDQLTLTAKQRANLVQGLNQMDSFSEIILKLAQFGIRKKVATKLYQLYHGAALKKLESDPYASVAEVPGYGFKTADELGHHLGITPTDSKRIKGAIFQVLLNELNDAGNTYVAQDRLLNESKSLLGISSSSAIEDEFSQLEQDGKIVIQDKRVSLAKIHQTEAEIAQALKDLIKGKAKDNKKYPSQAINKALAETQQELKIKYDLTQKAAIINAVSHPISILTGGPGTGKTTIINGILSVLRRLAHIPASALYSQESPFLLAAPTGRAAKRMSEVTGISAKTIHRLLGLGIGQLQTTDLNELNGEILIIDEMSMVDMFLFKQLIINIKDVRHLVFVGDKDQLPSVGAGNVFSNLIKAHTFPTTVLTDIHRQKNNSTIITLAHAVNAGLDQQSLFQKTKNYSFISCQPQLVGDAVGQIVKLALKRGFVQDDIQVLGAMYHGNGGINNLNDILQNIMNPPKAKSKALIAHHETFRIGDRILQLQNNPEKDIYNGEIGKVIGLEPQSRRKCLIAKFDEREVTFGQKDLLDLTRAYAITIHKSQGSEFPLVILNLTMQNYVMLKRNLLYTAITRAEKNLVLVGDPRAFTIAFNTPGNDRKTGLVAQLQQELPILTIQTTKKKSISSIEATKSKEKNNHRLTKAKIYSGAIDPMIGMQGISLKALQ